MTVDDLRKAREIANVAYIDFTRHIRENKDGLFCFFENKDAPYFQVQIRRLYQGNYYPIPCGNKTRVLKVYQLIDYHRIYDKYKKGFFIDRDFDPLQNNPAIYETPCYAIENLYINSRVLSEILKNELQLMEVSESYKNAMSLYEDLLSQFLEAITLFNAWYSCQIDWKHKNGKKLPFSLDNKMAINFIQITLEKIEANYNLEIIKKKFPKAINISEEVIIQRIEELNQVDKRYFFRGKSLIKFLAIFLELLIIDSRNQKNIIPQRLKYGVNYNQAISQFAQYAETPQSLTEYLKRVLN